MQFVSSLFRFLLSAFCFLFLFMITENEFNAEYPQATLHRQIHPAACIPPEAESAQPNTIDFRSSDSTLDRYQEVITVAGWKLETYRKNPVVQNAHSYCSLADTIGKSIITEVRSGAGVSPASYLFQRIQFVVEENPMAKVAYGLYRGGFLKAVSVGFIPLRWENGSKETGYRRKYVEQELIEVSAVSIPANPNALTLALKAGAVQESDLRALFDLLRHFCAEAQGAVGRLPSAGAPPSPLLGERAGVRGNSAHDVLESTLAELRLRNLTRQMNQIRSILKRA